MWMSSHEVGPSSAARTVCGTATTTSVAPRVLSTKSSALRSYSWEGSSAMEDAMLGSGTGAAMLWRRCGPPPPAWLVRASTTALPALLFAGAVALKLPTFKGGGFFLKRLALVGERAEGVPGDLVAASRA